MYRDYKYFDNEKLSNELENEISKIGSLTLSYDSFKNACVDAVNKLAPFKKKYVRGHSLSTYVHTYVCVSGGKKC